MKFTAIATYIYEWDAEVTYRHRHPLDFSLNKKRSIKYYSGSTAFDTPKMSKLKRLTITKLPFIKMFVLVILYKNKKLFSVLSKDQNVISNRVSTSIRIPDGIFSAYLTYRMYSYEAYYKLQFK